MSLETPECEAHGGSSHARGKRSVFPERIGTPIIISSYFAVYINYESTIFWLGRVSANVSDGTNTRSSSPSLKTYEKRQKNVMENCCLHYYKTLQTLMMNVSFRTMLFQDPDIKNGAYE